MTQRSQPPDRRATARLLKALDAQDFELAERELAAGADGAEALDQVLRVHGVEEPELVRFLTERCDLATYVSLERQVTPLMIAAHDGDDAFVDALLNKGADALLEDEDGWSAAHYAASSGCFRLAARLLAKPDRGVLREAALRAAERVEPDELVVALEDPQFGADTELLAEAWAIAAQWGRLESVRLIEERAKAGYRDGPLRMADDATIARAYVGAANRGAWDAMQLFAERAEALCQQDVDQALVRAASEGHAPIVDKLLTQPQGRQRVGPSREALNTAAWRATQRNRPEVVAVLRALLTAGADPDTRFSDVPSRPDERGPILTDPGTTIAMLAAAWHHHEILYLLRDHGADMKRKDEQGRTAVSYASWRKAHAPEQAERTIDLLLGFGLRYQRWRIEKSPEPPPDSRTIREQNRALGVCLFIVISFACLALYAIAC